MQEGMYHDNFEGHKHECLKCRALRAELTELREAVRWEMECENQALLIGAQHDWLLRTMRGVYEMRETYKAARAAVDALVGEG